MFRWTLGRVKRLNTMAVWETNVVLSQLLKNYLAKILNFLWTTMNGFVNSDERILKQLHLKRIHKCPNPNCSWNLEWFSKTWKRREGEERVKVILLIVRKKDDEYHLERFWKEKTRKKRGVLNRNVFLSFLVQANCDPCASLMLSLELSFIDVVLIHTTILHSNYLLGSTSPFISHSLMNSSGFKTSRTFF